jgi:Fe2+ or Zn2+ uptake regulation protein
MGASTKTCFELVEPYSVEAFIGHCRASGLRMGRLRGVIARAILQTSAPFDFDALWAAARAIEPSVSRGTIYLSLRRFCQVGLIRVFEQYPLEYNQEIPHIANDNAAYR